MKIFRNSYYLSVFIIIVAITVATARFVVQINDEARHQAAIEQEQGIQTFWRLVRERGGVFRIAGDTMTLGGRPLKGDYELPDTVSAIFGGTATIFQGSTRISTSVRRPDGSRAIGTSLQGPAYEALFRQGKPYRGVADILGVPYFTAYDPIRDSSGKVIGALYVGTKTGEFLEHYRQMRREVIATAVVISAAFALLAGGLLRLRRRTDRELEFKETAIATSVTAMAFSDLTGRLTYVNRAFLEMWGGTERDDVLGRHAVDFWEYPEDAAAVMAQVRETGHWTGELVGRRNDGSTMFVQLTASLVPGGNGSDSALMATFVDMTATRRAEEALRASEERYRAVFETTGTATVISEEDTTLSLVNDEFVRLSGYRREEIEEKKSWTEFVADHCLQRMLAYHRARRTGGGTAPATYEFDFVDRSGTPHNILTSVKMIPGTTRSVMSYQDITPQRRAQRLQEGETRIMELIAGEAPLAEVLERICLTVEGQANGGICSILLVNPDGTRLRHGAAPSLPDDYNRIIDGTRIGPAIGSCGTAAHERRQVIVADIAVDPFWAKYRSLPLAHGLRACWSTPVISSTGELLGTFALYYRSVCRPCDDELRLIERATHLASIAIGRSRVRESLEANLRSLKTLQRQQQAILDNIPDIVWLKDTESRFIAVNEAFAHACGSTPAALRGKSDLDVWPRDLAELYRQDDRRVMAERRRCRIEEALDDGGERRWIETIKTPVIDENGNVVGTTGIARDIEGRKRAEEALSESEERFREIFEQNEDAIVLLRRESFDVIDANPAAERLFGYSRGELAEVGPWSFIAPEEYNTFIQAVPPPGEAAIFHMDRLGNIRKSGESIIVSIWGKTIRLRSEEVIYCSIRNITDRIRLEEEARNTQARLIHANKMTSLGVLVSGIAHEINNPNTFIQGNAGILEKVWLDVMPILVRHCETAGSITLGGLPFDDIGRIVPRLLLGLKEGSRRISAIVGNLKDFAREDKAVGRGPIDVNKIIRDAALILSHHIHRQTDSFQLRLDDTIPPAVGKAQQVEQVVINLIMNGLQALPGREAGLTVSSRLDRDAAAVVITVRDDGEGMSEEVMARLTEPFFSTKLERGGTGLGLSICASIIQEHNGSLQFESAPGAGTTATVTLPAAPAEGNR